MKKITYLLIILLAIIITYSLVSIYISRCSEPFSLWGTEELIKFASFLGGTVVPFHTLLTFLILVLQLNVQEAQIKQLNDNALEERHIKMLDILIDDMNSIENTKIITSTDSMALFTLGAMLNNPTLCENISDKVHFNKLIDNYIQLLAQYADSVKLYQDNITPHIAGRIYLFHGRKILEKLSPHLDSNNGAQKIAIGNIASQFEVA